MESAKVIWLVQQSSMPPELGHFNRQYNFGKYLIRDGYKAIAFAGSKLHNSDVQMITDKRKYLLYNKSECPFVFIKTCDYGNSMKKRLIAEFQFHWNLFWNKKEFPKPDVILGSSSYMLTACMAIILAKYFKCKSIVEVRDLWPQSIVDYLGYSPKNPAIRFLYKVEKWMYEKADELIFTMEGGKEYIIEHNMDTAHGGKVDMKKVHYINNGVDLEKYYASIENNTYDDKDLSDPDKICIVYTGSIRRVNNLEYIVNIAEHFRNTNVHFLIWGQGDEKERLELLAEEKKVTNICFKGHVEKKYIPSILSHADLLLLHCQYAPVHKYGYSANKFFDYLGAEKPIISDIDCKYELVESNGVGIVIPNDNVEEAVDLIQKLINDKKKRESFSHACSEVVKEYDFKNLTKRLEKVM